MSWLADESITYVLSRVLPLCEHYVAVDRFVEVHSRFEYGLVNHSFCAAIRALLKVCMSLCCLSQDCGCSALGCEMGVTGSLMMCAITLCLQEYLVLIAQLEAQFRKGKLTLQKVR